MAGATAQGVDVRSYSESKSEPSVSMYPGGLIVHINGDIAACTEDDEPDGCTGRLAIHSLSPRSCIDEWRSCSYCGVVVD